MNRRLLQYLSISTQISIVLFKNQVKTTLILTTPSGGILSTQISICLVHTAHVMLKCLILVVMGLVFSPTSREFLENCFRHDETLKTSGNYCRRANK